MYKIASEKTQARHQRQIIKDGMIDGGRKQIWRSELEQLENLRHAIVDLDNRFANGGGAALTADERRALGKRKLELQEQMKELKLRLKRNPAFKLESFPARFLEVAERLLPKDTFEKIRAEARGKWGT